MANVLTNAGKGVITNRFLADAPLNMFIGWGTGAGTSAVADTTLFTEAAEERAAATATQETVGTANDTVQAVGTLQATGNRAITNVGLFDAVTSGNLIMKSDFGVLNLSTGDSITFTLQLQFT